VRVTASWLALAALAAVGAGMAAAWLSAGSTGALAGLAVALAAGNGYAKAYSP
jgi:fatty acid/phospholipid biosynthesis enzyme